MIDIVAALESSFDEIHYLDFYREIFPEGSFEEKGVYEDGKYNGIAVAIEKGGKRTKRLTVSSTQSKKPKLRYRALKGNMKPRAESLTAESEKLPSSRQALNPKGRA